MTPGHALKASYSHCARIARRQARNFYYAFLLLPAERRRSMNALYAFLRRTDDLADDAGSDSEKAQALHAWRTDLDALLAGRHVAWPGALALADTVARHAIPPALLHQAIDGVLMDVTHRSFDTFHDLADYCHHVASVVGLSCLHIWGYRSEGGRAEALAEHDGLALQLTNILRDVGEDARAGRVYLPREDLERFGVLPAELARPEPPDERIRALLEFQALRARDHYQQAEGLVPLVDPVGRPALRTIVGIYRALLDEIIRQDYDVRRARVALPATRKIAVAIKSLCQ